MEAELVASLIEWTHKSLVGICAIYTVKALYEMKQTIDHLNGRIDKIAMRTEWHSKSIEQLDRHLERLKN